MSEQQLRSAYELMAQGSKREAAQLVREVLQKDKNNASAWWLMSMLLEDEDKKVRALERVLSIRPDHKGARKKLAELSPERKTGQNIMATQEVMGLDLSRIKDEPQPAAQKPKKEEMSDDHRIATYGMLALGGFLLVVIVLFGGMSIYNSLADMRVERTARAYLNAFGDLDFARVAALTCEQYRSEIDAAQEELTTMTNGVNMDELSLDLSGITLEVRNRSSTAATVKVGGEFTMSMAGVDMSFNIEEMSDIVGDDTNVALVKENGEWRVCESSGL